MPLTAQVAVATKLARCLTYAVADAAKEDLKPGHPVSVPLGRRRVTGVVWSITDGALPASLAGKELKTIDRRLLDRVIFPEPYRAWLEWAAQHYLATLGDAVRAALPPFLLHPGRGMMRGPKSAPGDDPVFHKSQVIRLTDEQQGVLTRLREARDRNGQRRFLLHGITGSGKTEVYAAVIDEVVARGAGAICLVPEIGLTPQLAGEFRGRYRERLALFHSGLTPAQRSAEWLKVYHGEATIVLGTRSALFLPVRRLGLVILDEEHDPSYKQSSGFRYHARTMALKRADLEGGIVLLGSATPSCESLAMASSGDMASLTMTGRPTGQPLPTIEIVDLRRRGGRTLGASWLSEELREAIATTTAAGHQVLLFLNRKGFAPHLICAGCGEILSCPDCAIGLALHKRPERLICHYCDRTLEVQTLCSKCQTGRLIPIGAGTERIETEIRKAFPHLKVARLDRTVAARAGYIAEVLSRMKRREIDILIGTQMVAKGHDYPGIALVGVVSADTALAFPDFRAGERSYQLLVQVAGRSGRGSHPGRVLVQSYHPDHPAIRAALFHDPEPFYAAELKTRRALGYPPFSTLVLLRISGPKLERVTQRIETLHRALCSGLDDTVTILGPAPAPIARLRGRHRWQLLLKAPDWGVTGPALGGLLDRLCADRVLSAAELEIDVDPTDML